MPFKPARRESDHPAGPAFFMAPAEGKWIQAFIASITIAASLPYLCGHPTLWLKPLSVSLTNDGSDQEKRCDQLLLRRYFQ